ncbi:hypothetical protein DWW97_02180 [Dorea longicatena]|nr:hypothetical protein DWW97_02180 [Dorea longicatena]
MDCKPPQWNHSRRKYRRYRNEFYFPISENIRSYRCISNFFYQREGFIIQCEGLDEATGEKERPVSVQDMSLARIGEL